MRHSRLGKMRTFGQGHPIGRARRRLPVVAALAAGITVAATFAGCSAGKPSPGSAADAAPATIASPAYGASPAAGAAPAAGASKAVGWGATPPGEAARAVALRQAAEGGQAAEGAGDGPQILPVDPGAGRLRQTQAFPSTHDVAFRDAMDDLWLAITKDRPDYASQSFFPEAAYVQAKAISYAASDWTNRLWLDFELDVHAAHAVVGGDAHLVRVDMAPDWEAAWIPPGYCYNAVGYWHINGARLVYDRYGEERSIGVASLISWRGVWYVVHFGGVIRPAVGIVDDAETGPGYPGPAGGC